ncbi:MAG: hypothetical protein HDQ87_01105 [Clostridia bacterium]|nr:hypothetical protein [Clostridia bacterium]
MLQLLILQLFPDLPDEPAALEEIHAGVVGISLLLYIRAPKRQLRRICQDQCEPECVLLIGGASLERQERLCAKLNGKNKPENHIRENSAAAARSVDTGA